jgi:hypothetical protein
MMILQGQSALRETILPGQYRIPQGLYFGGDRIQEETRVLMELYRQRIDQYEQIIHLDMHTGYGPRYQMSLINAPLEKRSSQALQIAYDYPRVVSANPDEFYTMQGDMVNWVCRLGQEEFPSKRLYSAAFEFGTFGDSIPAVMRSLRAPIFENQTYWFGTKSPMLKKRVADEFQKAYFPSDEAWQRKAISDARRAFDGILGAEGFLSSAG